jgi:divalent metal cation (Fe/Co/Zn/Cd) transporter
MSPQRRTALVSVAAAGVLLVLKLTVGLATQSLGLISEAIHSGTDLVAAVLTFLAIGVAGKPADRTHQYGHGKA